MYTECETWRKDFKVDEIVRDFVYTEKPKVFEYYPQYYHKTDKVRHSLPGIPLVDAPHPLTNNYCIAGRPPCLH